ncbi:MAG: acyl carrier protein [Aquabacterium sp.]
MHDLLCHWRSAVIRIKRECFQMEVQARIVEAVRGLLEDPSQDVQADSRLIGETGLLDSMKLVELCLMLEDLGTEMGFEFDWTSDTAMSRSKSMFRTPATLATEFMSQRAAAS